MYRAQRMNLELFLTLNLWQESICYLYFFEVCLKNSIPFFFYRRTVFVIKNILSEMGKHTKNDNSCSFIFSFSWSDESIEWFSLHRKFKLAVFDGLLIRYMLIYMFYLPVLDLMESSEYDTDNYGQMSVCHTIFVDFLSPELMHGIH